MTIFFDKQIIIKRYKTRSGNKRTLVSTATADVAIQPLGKQGSEISEGTFGSTYVAYVEVDTPVQKADKILDSNGIEYSVTDVILRDYGGLQHKEVIMEKQS